MKKKILYYLFASSLVFTACQKNNQETPQEKKLTIVKKKKTMEEKRTATIERELHDFNMQKDPATGLIPRDQKKLEFENSLIAKEKASKFARKGETFISRGPSNFGGRTRAITQDISDTSGKTFIAGGVSSGVFRTTDGGLSWTKVSGNDEIHNVTAIVQDTRVGFQNIWYYSTGEWSGNSAGLDSTPYFGHGVWKSTDNGITWSQIPATSSNNFTTFDAFIDFIAELQVHPTTGELFIASAGRIYRFDGVILNLELSIPGNTTGWTDVKITSTGIVYATIQGNRTNGGVWTSPTGNSSWTQIASNGTPTEWSATGRITLGIAPSNENIVYALYDNGKINNPPSSPQKEADLWKYDAVTASWTNYSSKLPDEDGAALDSAGNDPFSIQGGYDLIVSVKPDDENFVVIGGTNIYKINNITTDASFERRIGGYQDNTGYTTYSTGGVDHHPDIHAIKFDLFDNKIVYSGTDGGIHKTADITAVVIPWSSLNNNYQTYQYYYVSMLNQAGSDFIIGGAQDNGTTVGGLSASGDDVVIEDSSTMRDYFGGDGASVAVAKFGTDFSVFTSTQNGRMFSGNGNFPTTIITPKNPLNNEDYPSKFVTYFYMDPDNNAIIYYASEGKVLRTNFSFFVTSTNWKDIGDLPNGDNISNFETTRGAYAAATSKLFIGSEEGNIYRINDPKNATTDVSNALKMTPQSVTTNQYVSDIAIHPTNPDILLVTYSNYNVQSIFLTTNATAATPTWTLVERNLNIHSIRSAAIAELNGQITYYVGTARGLYSSNDPTTQDWELEGANTIGFAIISSLVYRHSDHKLLVGTHGNGMFETTVGTLATDDFTVDDVAMVIYPNPTIFELNFASNQIELNDKTKFTISDVRGSIVKKGFLKDKKIDVSKLSKGMYIVQIKEDTKVASKKFIKN